MTEKTERSATGPSYERCFDAALKALEHLDSTRPFWNGPIHQAAAVLRKAVGPQPDVAPVSHVEPRGVGAVEACRMMDAIREPDADERNAAAEAFNREYPSSTGPFDITVAALDAAAALSLQHGFPEQAKLVTWAARGLEKRSALSATWTMSEAERLSKKWLSVTPIATINTNLAGALLRDALHPVGESATTDGTAKA